MARPPSEKLTLQGDHYKIRLHHADGTRPWFHFAPGMSEARCLGLLPKIRAKAKAGELAGVVDFDAKRNRTFVAMIEIRTICDLYPTAGIEKIERQAIECHTHQRFPILFVTNEQIQVVESGRSTVNAPGGDA